MNYLFLQLLIAQNRDDVEKWVNILFIAVLAVFWLLRGVVKAKVDEVQRQKQKQPPVDKTRSPSSAKKQWSESLLEKILGQSDLSSQPHRRPVSQNTMAKAASSRALKHKLISKSKPDKSFPYQADKKRKASRFYLSKPSLEQNIQDLQKIDTNLQELPEFTTKALESISDKPLSKSSDITQAKYLSELIWDYQNTDELRKAILHYEILGKPLSLRDSSDSLY